MVQTANGGLTNGKMKAPKHAEKLVAEHQAALAKLLFEKNPTGTARPLAQLLSQTEEGKEELGRKRKFNYKGNEKKIVEAVSDPEEEIHIFEPRDTFAEEMNRRSEAVFYLVCDFLFPDRMANEVTEASSASKIRQTSAARNPGSK